MRLRITAPIGLAATGACFVAMGAAAPALAGGDPDTTFGSNGRLTTEFGGAFDWIRDLAIDAQGRILGVGTGGSSNRHAIARYLPSGAPDPSFSGDGQMITTVDFSSGGPGVIPLPDGTILVGVGLGSPRNFAVMKLLDNGSLDLSFGAGGIAEIAGANQARVGALALQPDGKIIIGGYDLIGSNWNWVIGRFTPEGDVDVDFGVDGKAVIDFSRPEIQSPIDFLVSLLLLPNGKVLAGGLTSTTSQMSTGNRIYAMARLNPDGSLDDAFPGAGRHVFSYTVTGFQQENISDLILLPDGKVLGSSGGGSETALIRFNADGAIDTTFGVEGRIVAPAGAAYRNPLDIELDVVNGILAAGDFAVTRFFLNGEIDASFGVDGTASVNWGTQTQGALALTQTPEGRILLGGFSGTANVDTDWSLAAFTPGVSCPGDVDGDDDVDIADLARVLSGFGSQPATLSDGDIDGDDDVDIFDLSLALRFFGTVCDG